MRVVSLLPAATEIVAALGGAIGAPAGAEAVSGPVLVGGIASAVSRNGGGQLPDTLHAPSSSNGSTPCAASASRARGKRLRRFEMRTRRGCSPEVSYSSTGTPILRGPAPGWWTPPNSSRR
jgi:hypothetical protein